MPLFAVLELDRGIVYEQGKRHKRQKRLCIPSFEQGRSMASFLVAVHRVRARVRARGRGRMASFLSAVREGAEP